MGLISRIFGSTATSARNSGDDFWWSDSAMVPAAGYRVTRERMLQLAVVQDCLRTLADPIATLPLVWYRLASDGSKDVIENAAARLPLANLLAVSPDDEMTAAEFLSQMQWDLGVYNNAYAEIGYSGDGVVTRLRRLDPERVRPYWSAGRRFYDVRDAGGLTRTLSESAEMWHLRAPPLDDLALAGRSHLEMSAELLSGALALQDYAARYWLNDGRPPGWIEHPSSFKTAEDRARFMAALKRAHSGRNRHSLGVLEWGMKFKDVGATNESSQFLETMKEKDVALTRLWNVPPHKVGILDRATFSNIEQQSIEFVRDTLGAWLVVWQQSIKVNLIGNRRDARLYCEFDLTDLLRGDLQSRFAAYNQARTGGWMSINDIRRRERMSPIENGDTYLEPLNMRRVGEPGPARIITPEQDRAEPPENGAVPPANGNGARRPNGRGHHA